MDDIGFGEHIAAFVLTIFDLICVISSFFFLYKNIRKSYFLLISVLLNIISSVFFGIHGVGSFIGTMNFELWPFVNFVLLVIFSVNYNAIKDEKDHLKVKGNQLQKWFFRLVVVMYIPWFFLAIWFFLDSSV